VIKTVTVENNSYMLTGPCPRVGGPAPDFRIISTDLSETALSSFGNRIKLITFFFSIDTPVCDIQVREFNRRAADLAREDLGREVAVIGISRDLPYALKRFTGTFDISNIELYSDFFDASFGTGYGVLIRELGLLARGVIILDGRNIIRYVQVVKDLANQPDFDACMEELKKVMEKPEIR